MIFFLHAQKVPQVERHSGSEVSDDLHPAPLCSAPLHPPPLPDEGGNEELCIDDDVVEVKCEQVRFFLFKMSMCILNISYGTFLKRGGFKKDSWILLKCN